MISLGFAPDWFFRYGILLELIFAILALLVALYSFKVYKVSKESSIRLFGTSFLLFSASYFIQSILNIGILYKLSENISALQKTSQVISLGLNAVFVHIFFSITALTILATMFFKSRNMKMFLLLLSVSIIPLFFTHDVLFNFFILSTIYLVFITYHYMKTYSEKKKARSLLVFLAFLILLLSNVSFFMSLINKIFYVIAHFLILTAYLLILINLYWCRLNEKTR